MNDMTEITAHRHCPIPAEMIGDLVDYDRETGKIFWKTRDLSWFPLRRVGLAFNSTHAGKEAFTATDGRGYKSGRIFDRTYPAHRVAWAAVYGVWPNVIDHINGDRTDNRMSNLRNVTKADNSRNRSSFGKPLGVSYDASRGLWRARAMMNYRDIHIGYFQTEAQAIAARTDASISLGFHPLHGSAK